MTNLAIFDLDHTLISCDTEACWVDFLYSKGLVNQDFLKKRDELFYQYANGSVNASEFIEFQLSSIIQLTTDDIHALYPEFFNKFIVPNIYPKAQYLINEHKKNHDTLLLLSASNILLITPIAHEFGIDNIIGVIPQVNKKGEFTGKVAGVPSFREGKVIRLQAWLDDRNQTLDDFDKCWFYSDSINDLPLLDMVTHPCAVNADKKLAAVAKQRQWQILDFD
ncbi:MAG: HAD family hydrolase [Moraxella sp.]|nr:HAD family hydrolase [Moraxella sp.]